MSVVAQVDGIAGCKAPVTISRSPLPFADKATVMKKRVLVVDDSYPSARLLEAVLDADGFHVQVARDAGRALVIASQERFDVVLVDLELPGMNGCELTRALKSNPRMENVPIIVVTACDLDTDEKKARSAGAQCVMAKPIDPMSLRNAIATCVAMGEA
jgi:CheY-like chemotaxis protein